MHTLARPALALIILLNGLRLSAANSINCGPATETLVEGDSTSVPPPDVPVAAKRKRLDPSEELRKKQWEELNRRFPATLAKHTNTERLRFLAARVPIYPEKFKNEAEFVQWLETHYPPEKAKGVAAERYPHVFKFGSTAERQLNYLVETGRIKNPEEIPKYDQPLEMVRDLHQRYLNAVFEDSGKNRDGQKTVTEWMKKKFGRDPRTPENTLDPNDAIREGLVALSTHLTEAQFYRSEREREQSLAREIDRGKAAEANWEKSGARYPQELWERNYYEQQELEAMRKRRTPELDRKYLARDTSEEAFRNQAIAEVAAKYKLNEAFLRWSWDYFDMTPTFGGRFYPIITSTQGREPEAILRTLESSLRRL